MNVPFALAIKLSVAALAEAGACFFFPPPLDAQLAIPTVLNSVPRARYSFLIVRPAMTLEGSRKNEDSGFVSQLVAAELVRCDSF